MDKLSIFEILFPDVAFDYSGNTQVCCPFPHDIQGEEFYETNPSAGIDISNNLFHCFSCDRGFRTEISFAKEYFSCDVETAEKYLKILKMSKDLNYWEQFSNRINEAAPQNLLRRLGISDETVEELKIGYNNKGISIPIILHERIVDIVTYDPENKPKYTRVKNSMSGLPVPYDLWKTDQRNTLICAGEKDMLMARTKGFNAISFTGGESNVPKLYLKDFKNRNVFIIYDNDDVGRIGAKKLAAALYNYTKKVYIVDISSVCSNEHEDLWDFFMIYAKEKKDLVNIMQNSKLFTEEEYKTFAQVECPLIKLGQAVNPMYINKKLRSEIQIVSTFDTTFSLPTALKLEKLEANQDSKTDLLAIGTYYWNLKEYRYKDIFYMIDSKLKEKEINSYIITNLFGGSKTETKIKLSKMDIVPVYKCSIIDSIDTDIEVSPTEFTAYSLNKKLDNSKKYMAYYRLVPHPQDGQKLIIVIDKVEEATDFINSFKINNTIVEALKIFKPTSDSNEAVRRKYIESTSKIKGIVGKDLNQTLLTIIDLWFNSVLQIHINGDTIRGYIDALVVSETRLGKSTTVKALKKIYGIGKIISLAGTQATIPGIIGGSNAVGGAYQTKAGLLPQNNRGAVIFEELSKCRNDIIKELTEVRSSNKVRITRVSGSIELPAYVRMLTLSNCKVTNGTNTRPIRSYPNGIAVLTDIIGTPEDIARYDLIAILAEDSTKDIDPYYKAPEPYPSENLKTRLEWIWSRKPDQIKVNQDTYVYLIGQQNTLNREFPSHIKLFGIETWMKLLRIATAIAGCLVSTDASHENIVVHPIHVELAEELLRSLYDNPVFKFREYTSRERRFNEFTPKDVEVLQDIYVHVPRLIEVIVQNTGSSKASLYIMANMSDKTVFDRNLGLLVTNDFIRLDDYNVYSTQKLNQVYQKIDKDQKPKEMTISFDD